MPISLPPLARFYLYTPPAQAIATGVLNVTRAYHTIDTEGGAATDDLDTISGLAVDSMIVTLRTLTSERAVVLKHNTGNLYLPSAADVTLNGSNRAVTLAYNATLGKWQHADEAGFLLCDLFTDTRAGGAVNGTPATPGPGTRTVVDTESKLTITGGALSFAGGKASPAWGDPGIWYGSLPLVRLAGRLLLANVALTLTNQPIQIGFDANLVGAMNVPIWFSSSGTILESTGQAIAAYTATTYKIAVVLRSTGAYLLLKGGAFSSWTLLWQMFSDTNSPLYAAISNNAQIATIDNLRVPAALWLPTPLVYTVFGGAAGDLAGTLTDSTGPDAQTTPQRTWASSASVWALSGA